MRMENRPAIRTAAVRVHPDPESHRRWGLRSNHLVPIYVMWTSDVPDREAEAALRGTRDTVTASGQNREIVVLGSNAWGTGAFSSPDWYIEEAYRRQSLRRNAGFGPQIDVSAVMGLFYEEPWQVNPHWEVFIVNHDLNDIDETGRYINFVFGATNTEFHASVQSITRLMAEVADQPMRLRMIQRLLRHEVGHMFGLMARNYSVEQKLGLHCTNVCTMRQGLSTEEWARQTQQEDTLGIQFCIDCLSDLTRMRPRYLSLP